MCGYGWIGYCWAGAEYILYTTCSTLVLPYREERGGAVCQSPYFIFTLFALLMSLLVKYSHSHPLYLLWNLRYFAAFIHSAQRHHAHPLLILTFIFPLTTQEFIVSSETIHPPVTHQAHGGYFLKESINSPTSFPLGTVVGTYKRYPPCTLSGMFEKFRFFRPISLNFLTYVLLSYFVRLHCANIHILLPSFSFLMT